MSADERPRGPRAVGLVLRRSPRLLGIEPFYAEFIGGMEEVVASRGMQVLLQVVPALEDELATYRRWAAGDDVVGVVLGDLHEGDVRASVLAELGLATLILGEPEVHNGEAILRVDNYGAMADAVRHLAALGHLVIGRVSGPETLMHTRARSDAFRTVTEQIGLRGHEYEGDYTEVSGEAGTRALLALPNTPTAIIYDNDVMAIAGLGVAYELGIAVPDALSLLAWDDSTLCRLAVPPLSAMSRDVHELGVMAGHSLLQIIDGGPNTDQQAPPPRFITRGTTGTVAPAGHD